jgi:hypothetical protein
MFKKYLKKKYVMIYVIVAYVLFKIFVTYTPTKEDDELPDLFKDAFINFYGVK